MHLSVSLRVITAIILSSISLSGFTQTGNGSDSLKQKDSHTKGFAERMQDFARQSEIKSKADFESAKALAVQVSVFEEVRLTMQSAKSYMKSGLDTLILRENLRELQDNFSIAADGVFFNRGAAQTYRNLTATKKILNELIAEARLNKVRLDTREKALNGYQFRMDSLLTTKELFSFPKDSLELMDYLRSLAALAKETGPVDTTLKIASRNVQRLLNAYNLEINHLRLSVDEIERDEHKMARNTLTREFPNIAAGTGSYRPFQDILNFSWIKGLLTLRFYTINNIWKLLAILVLTLISFIYLRSLKRIYSEKKLLDERNEGQLVVRYPILSATLLVISIFQFLFFSPPFILNVILWLISCTALTIIFKGYITRYWMTVWLIMVLFFFLSAADNLVLQPSAGERWFMLAVALCGIFSGIVVLIQKRRNELREKWIGYSIALMVALEICALLLNISGRYNVSKTLFIGGFLNVILAILFLWVVRLINEGLVLAVDVYTVQDKKLFYLNFGKVGSSAPLLLYLLLIMGWVVLMGHNFPLFEYLSQPVLNFLSKDRVIGDYSFSINSLFLFFTIMSVSVIVSKVVSFFASDDHLTINKENDSKKQRLGSWLLLVRIFILSIGLFLAIAAAGIPMDRITIIIGALGVGIGFGLQTLVNNLVSGLIIAFEKPVNVGDIVDVDGQGGTMKSIGFRSSVINTWDGADLVMPNGDLLNSHLMNWTLAGNRKRISILIGIAYDADLEKCRQIIIQILDQEERISKSRPPVVQFEQFGTSAIDLRIFFWTRHLSDNNSTRSDLIISITNALKSNHIQIPFPQQEVHLHLDKKDQEKQ